MLGRCYASSSRDAECADHECTAGPERSARTNPRWLPHYDKVHSARWARRRALEVFSTFLLLRDLIVQIAAFGVVHNNTKVATKTWQQDLDGFTSYPWRIHDTWWCMGASCHEVAWLHWENPRAACDPCARHRWSSWQCYYGVAGGDDVTFMM